MKKTLPTFIGILILYLTSFSVKAYTSCALEGTYTIDKSQPTGGVNFNSFQDAVGKLDTCGVSGHVVFNVVSGTYTEQFTLGPVAGAGDTATITFQADPVNLQAVELTYNASGNADNYVIHLDSASYITIKGLQITATSNTYGRVIDLTGYIQQNKLVENVIESHSPTSVVIENLPNNGNVISHSTIENNIIKGGRVGIMWRNNDNNTEEWNSIENNSIRTTGTDYAVFCAYQKNFVVKNNFIRSDTGGGILLENSGVVNVEANTVIAYAQDGMFIDNCIAGPGQIHRIINNMVSSLGSANSGIRMRSCEYLDIVHNSVLEHSSSGNGKGLFINSSETLDNGNRILNNNIVNIGKGSVVYVDINEDPKGVHFIADMNYNNFYPGDSAVLGVFEGDTAHGPMEWRSLSSNDLYSVSYDPFFFSDTNLRVSSLNLSVDNPIPGISEDMDQQTRSVNYPTTGADEIPNFTQTGCSPFSELQVDSLKHNSFKLSWTPGTNSNTFKIEYGPSGFAPGGASGTIVSGTYPGTNPLLRISGLSASTVYDIYFEEICNSGSDTTKSQLTIETDEPCPFKGVIIEALGHDSVSFSMNSFNADFDVEWGLTGFEQGTGMAEQVGNPFTIDSLHSNTTYDVYIRTNCTGSNDGASTWYGPITLTTLCEPSDILSGNYTINHLNVTSGRNFNSFGDAIDALNSCGISGPVVFNVAGGVYNEQMIIGDIEGISAQNTITFQADTAVSNVEVRYNALAADKNYVVRFIDASYITLRGIKFKITSAANFSRVIDFRGVGKHIVIEDNILEGKQGNLGFNQFETAIISLNVLKYDSCTIRGNNIKWGTTGICFGSGSGGPNVNDGNRVENNLIEEFSMIAVLFYNQTNAQIRNNTMKSSSFEFAAGGIDFEVINGVFESNRISTTIHDGVFFSRGAFVSGDNILVSNNMVSMQGDSPGEVQISAMGTFSSCNNVRFIHNTALMNISGSYGGLCFDSDEGGRIQGCSLLNNNFIALQNGRVIGLEGNTTLISDFNNFYYSSGGALGSYNGTPVTDLTSWQSITSEDNHSISVDPLLVSLTNLHAQSVLINDKGTPVAEVTEDIDGEVRSTTAPDIGADEFTPAPCLPSGNFQAYGLFSDSLQISWVPGSAMEFIIEYGTKGFTQGNGILITGITDTFYTIDGLSPNTEYDFYFRDYCSVGDTSAHVGPITIKTLCVGTSLLSGSYTINSGLPTSGTNFSSFTDAAVALNDCGVKGPVVINVASGAYNEKIALGDIYGTSTVNTVTFQPDNTNTQPVELTSDGSQGENYVIRFDNTRYVTVKGLYLSTGTTTHGTVLEFRGDCRSIMIDSNQIHGSQGSPSGTEQAVIKNDNAGTPKWVNDVKIRGNTVTGGSYGIYWYGVNSANLEEGNVIEGNSISGFTAEGIRSYYQDSIQIKYNELSSDNGNVGINAHTNSHYQIIGNKLTAKTGTGVTIENGFSSLNNSNVLANNMISIEGDNNTVTGMSLVDNLHANVLYNSVRISGNNSQTICIKVVGSNDSVTVYNNNLIHMGQGYAYMVSTVPAHFVTDHNNLYTTGNYIGSWNSSDITDLTAWQTASGQGSNSVSTDPIFNAANNLHAASPKINAQGIAHAAVSLDIDGEPRDPSAPDIGADEFTTLEDDLWTVNIIEPVTNGCGDSNTVVSVVVTNIGIQSANGFDVYSDLSGTLSAKLSLTYSGTLNSGQTDTVVLSSFNSFDGESVTIKTYTDYSNDQEKSNDTLTSTVYIQPTSLLEPVVAKGYFCAENPYDTLYFPAGIEDGLVWMTTKGDTIAQTDSVAVGPLSKDTSFVLTAREGCYKDEKVTIMASPFPVASFNINLQAPEMNRFIVNFNARDSEGAQSYSWDFGDGSIGAGQTINHNYTANGSYDVKLIVTGDCGSDTLIQTIEIAGITVEENILSRSLEVYPNPTSDKIYLSFDTRSSEDILIRLTDLSGKLIWQKTFSNVNGPYQSEINLSPLVKGSYMLRIKSGELRAVKRIVKN